MVVDHVGVFFFPDNYIYRFIGRFSFPIFFFLIGYTYQGLRTDTAESSNSAWAKYYSKLPILARKPIDFFWVFNIKTDLLICLLLITAVNAIIDHQLLPLNILFSVIICRVAVYLFERYNLINNWLIVSWLVLFVANYHSTLTFDYGSSAILLALFGYLVRHGKRKEPKALAFMILCYFTYCGFQMLYFPAEFNYITSLYIGIAALFIGLSDYQFQKTYILPNNVVINYSVMFISRYSLYVYTIHFVGFKIVSAMFS